MTFLLGFDPGGVSQFGWAVLAVTSTGRPSRHATGLSSNASEAVQAALAAVPGGSPALAAGIDSPMYWTPTGVREADLRVRSAVHAAGCRSPGGTVQHPNSLRGACVVQGPTVALLLRRSLPHLPITEAHPKALLFALSGDPGVADLLTELGPCTEHERDAALGAFAAWALTTQPTTWEDLVAREADPLHLVSPPVSYWFPRAAS